MSQCEALYQLLRACWPACKRAGCERELLRDNLPALRKCWSHKGIAAAIEHARKLGISVHG